LRHSAIFAVKKINRRGRREKKTAEDTEKKTAEGTEKKINRRGHREK